MNTPVLLEGFAAELVRRGLPVDYAQNTAAELADHHRDLTEELRSGGLSELEAEIAASERLGERRVLVKKSVREFQLRHWCARWPLVTFLLGPIPLLALTWIIFFLVLFCIFWPLEQLGMPGPQSGDGIISAGEWLANFAMVAVVCFIAPSVTLCVLARLAKRAALDWKWLIVSACLLGLTIGMVRCGFPQSWQRPTMFDGRPVPADQPLVTVGIPCFAPTWREALKWYAHDVQQTSQVLMPLILATALLLRNRQVAMRSERMIADC